MVAGVASDVGVDGEAVVAGVAGVGRRRMENRVTARTKARARAARPMREAPTTEAPSGSAAVSATARPFTLLDVLELGDGWSVGNSFAALPPGLSVGLVAGGTSGRLPTGSGVVVVIGSVGFVVVVVVAVPEIWTVADAFGSLGSLAALPITVSLTEFTDNAVAGTSELAWSCRCTDVESIAPRSHDAVPSLLPQPKLNFGAALDGDASSRMIASGMFPPVVQAVTTHWVVAPRLLVDVELAMSTQRLV